jgi:hypothetical protein
MSKRVIPGSNAILLNPSGSVSFPGGISGNVDVIGGTTFISTVSAIPATQTSYLLPFYNGFSTAGGFPWPKAGTIKSFVFRTNVVTGNNTTVFTLQIAGVDTALTYSLPATSVSGNYVSSGWNIEIAVADSIRIKVVNNCTDIASPIITAWTLEIVY